MNKKTMKLISFVTIALVVMFSMFTSVSALDANQITGNSDKVNVDKIGDVGNRLATIIRNVGIVAAVIILMILGIKYMMGSAEEKAEYKKTMIPYLVGAVVLFGASAIAGAVIQFSNGLV